MLQQLGERERTERVISQIASDVQDAVFDLTRWENIVGTLKNLALPGRGAVMLHASGPEGLVGLFQAGLEPAAVASYLANHAATNPWLEAQRHKRPGTVYELDDLVEPEALERSVFYQEWLLPNGGLSSGAGIVLARTSRCTIALDMLTSKGDAEAQAQARKILGRAGPELTLIAELTQRLTASTAERRRLEAALDLVSVPVLMVDRQLRCHYRNPASEQFLRRCDSLSVGDDLMLRCATGAAVSAIEAAIPQCDDGQEVRPIRLKNAAGRHVAHLTVHPLGGARSGGLERFFSGAEAWFMVMIRGHREAHKPPAGQLRRAFSLTPAESLLAQALLSGHSLASYAEKQGLSRNTVRNHLSSIMRKTKTRRQADIVRVLSQFA